MPTWTITTPHTSTTGTADTAAAAWDAAYRAAAEVTARQLGSIVLDVDGDRATVEPAESGDPAADVAATLAVLEHTRDAAVTAHQVLP